MKRSSTDLQKLVPIEQECDGCQVFDGFWRVWSGVEAKLGMPGCRFSLCAIPWFRVVTCRLTESDVSVSIITHAAQSSCVDI